MIVLVRRSNLILIVLILAVSVLFSIMSQSSEVVSVGAIPISNKVIVIDPGHGGEDGGASGKLTDVLEKDINLKIARTLKGLIEQGGDLAIMTRQEDVSIHDPGKRTLREKKNSDLKNRKKLIDSSGADLFISIHLNTFPESKYYGAQTFYAKENEKSKQLAVLVQEELKRISDRPNERKSMAKNDVIIMESPGIPGIMVECGFLSNPEDERLLASEEYQKKLAFAIYSGITRYFNDMPQ